MEDKLKRCKRKGEVEGGIRQGRKDEKVHEGSEEGRDGENLEIKSV